MILGHDESMGSFVPLYVTFSCLTLISKTFHAYMRQDIPHDDSLPQLYVLAGEYFLQVGKKSLIYVTMLNQYRLYSPPCQRPVYHNAVQMFATLLQEIKGFHYLWSIYVLPTDINAD